MKLDQSLKDPITNRGLDLIRLTFSFLYLYLYKRSKAMANPKRKIDSYYTDEYKTKQSLKVDRQFGPIEEHTKTCSRCTAEYVFVGRKHTKLYEKSRFCSRSCANHRGSGLEWANTHKERSLTHYRTLCFTNWERSCAICGFDKIVAVHHIDENHQNNDIKNLI